MGHKFSGKWKRWRYIFIIMIWVECSHHTSHMCTDLITLFWSNNKVNILSAFTYSHYVMHVWQCIIQNYIWFFSFRRRLEMMNMIHGYKHVRHSHHCVPVPYCMRFVWKLNTSFYLLPCFNSTFKMRSNRKHEAIRGSVTSTVPLKYLMLIDRFSYENTLLLSRH